MSVVVLCLAVILHVPLVLRRFITDSAQRGVVRFSVELTLQDEISRRGRDTSCRGSIWIWFVRWPVGDSEVNVVSCIFTARVTVPDVALIGCIRVGQR